MSTEINTFKEMGWSGEGDRTPEQGCVGGEQALLQPYSVSLVRKDKLSLFNTLVNLLPEALTDTEIQELFASLQKHLVQN